MNVHIPLGQTHDLLPYWTLLGRKTGNPKPRGLSVLLRSVGGANNILDDFPPRACSGDFRVGAQAADEG